MNRMMDIQIPLGRILDLCPQFKKKVLKVWVARLGMEIEVIEDVAPCNMTQPKELPTSWDGNAAKNNLMLVNAKIEGIILDGGSSVNIIIEEMATKIKTKWEPLSFNIRMENNRMVVSFGVVRHAKMTIANMEFLVNLVVLTMNSTATRSYLMLWVRPWLRDTKVKHD